MSVVKIWQGRKPPADKTTPATEAETPPAGGELSPPDIADALAKEAEISARLAVLDARLDLVKKEAAK